MSVHNSTAKLRSMRVVTERRYGATGNGSTDDTAAIQAAIDDAYLAGGGKVYLPTGKYRISASLLVPQRVMLIGEGASFVNPYIDNINAGKGTVLFLAPGSNCDVVVFRCLLTNVGGFLEETTIGGRNSDFRHGGGMRDITVFGNRSAAFSPAVRDLNTVGNGVRLQGARYIRLQDVICMYCAEDGVKVGSFDYGTGSAISNNLFFSSISSLSNYDSGFDFAGGDSLMTDLNAGFNGGTGMTYVMSGSVNGGAFWNNGTAGVYVALNIRAGAALNGLHSYDNDEEGFLIGGTAEAPSMAGCVGRGNGRDVAIAATKRANFSIGGSVQGWSLAGCRSSGIDFTGAAVTQYGAFVNNTTHAGSIEGFCDESSNTPIFMVSGDNVRNHGQTAQTVAHPPIKQTGQLDVNGHGLHNVGTLRFDGWSTITTITANTLTIGGNSLLNLNCTGAQTVNAMVASGSEFGLPLAIIRNTAADAVTFTHNVAALRCANATDVVLAQYEAVMFMHVSGDVWQQIGGAA